MKSVSNYNEALAGGGYFARQGGLIARQNLDICVSKTTCCAISTNLPSGWFYQDHSWSLINKYVVLHQPRSELFEEYTQFPKLLYNTVLSNKQDCLAADLYWPF